jgi:hypothetical protein
MALGMAHIVSGLGVDAEGFIPRDILLQAEKELFMRQIQNTDVLDRLGKVLGAK